MFLKKARNILEEIVKIFETTRKEKFEEFIKKLEVIANKKFQIISETGFAGTIKLNLLKNGNSYKIEIDLYSINNQVIDCSTSAKTSMYLSVLLAISELTKETQSVKYPLIMDAPISSFDPNKKRQLWKVLNEIDDTQIILVMYEFIDEVGEEKEPILNKKLYSKVAKRNGMFIKIKRPFDKNDLATINTEIHQLD
ncbi:hypothetical protein VSP20_03435 [Myroides phaeus]|uniref:hypothetical protein n=1 Tax=Myroides phaeus TaxID=702745 RepID=UPI002DBFE900|nr:hypothetical protein [Myroides phaeus]MEC4116015.1 hypothetical protein [Myroides phaeus]